MEEINKQTEVTECLDAPVSHSTDVLLGKFKDVNALLNAYNSLQSEFTKRCQRLKELEGAVNSDKNSPNMTEGNTNKSTEKIITDAEKNEIVKEYLKSVLLGGQVAVLSDGAGVGVKTPAQKPTSIAEAGKLAKQIF